MRSLRPPSAPSSPSLTLVVAEHFHAGLCVGVVGWLEAQLRDSCRSWPRQADDLRVTLPGPPNTACLYWLDCSPSLVKNSLSTPMRWPRVRPWSAITPSIWWNSARCVASSVSFRNTRSIEKYLAGVNGFWEGGIMARPGLALAWVRRSIGQYQPPTCLGQAVPFGLNDRGLGHWLLWYVCEGGFSGPLPASRYTCSFRRKSRKSALWSWNLSLPPLSSQGPGSASPL